MTHIAVSEQLDGKSTDWMKKVTDARTTAGANTQPTAAQRLMGDIAPKLAELTDQVLFADVWKRPQLSPGDRSLVTGQEQPADCRSGLAVDQRERQQASWQEEVTHGRRRGIRSSMKRRLRASLDLIRKVE
jgi:4-carboxymuconolactone decarboxylase